MVKSILIVMLLATLCSCSKAINKSQVPVQVKLEWTQPDCVNNDCYYEIFRSNCNELRTWHKIASTQELVYIDFSVERGKCYNYGVRTCWNINKVCGTFTIAMNMLVPSISGPLYYYPSPKQQDEVVDTPLLKKI